MSSARRFVESVRRRRGADPARTVLYREAYIERARAVEGQERTYEFVASTEAPVMTWFGPEVLRMSGCKMRRYRKNPVVLDTHNTWSIKSILGVGEPRIEDRKLLVRVTLDETPEGEAARQRIESGSLRAVSIGYRPNRKKTRQLEDGETDGTGDGKVTGPALVVREWELLEVTLCPVPADEDAVRRSFYGHAGVGRKESHMGKRSGIQYSQLPADDEARELEDEVDVQDEGGDEARQAPQEKPKRPRLLPAPTPAELRQRERAAVNAQIRDMTPSYLKDVAEDAILRGLDVDKARELLLEAKAKRQAPVGTPEPQTDTTGVKPEGEKRDAPLPETLTDDVLVRSFEQLQ